MTNNDDHAGAAHERSTPGPHPEPPLRREVVFMHSEAYLRALGALPVHPRREKRTLSLLLALDERYRRRVGSGGHDEDQGARVAHHAGETPDAKRTRGLGLQFIAPAPATADQLTRFHARSYIDTLRAADDDAQAEEATTTARGDNSDDSSEEDEDELKKRSGGDARRRITARHKPAVSEQQRAEYELVDDAFVFPGVYEYCRFVAGATITAAAALRHLVGPWRLAAEPGRLAPVAINLGGGRHHAMRSQGSGFCYVNDAVLGIQHLVAPGLGRLERVLCVDIDVHHGDGLQEAFYFSNSVLTLSFHLHERGFFPGTGGDDETGIGRGKFHNVNVPLRRGITDDEYLGVFTQVTERAVDVMDPEAIVLICGVDTLAKDTLGGFNMTARGITECVKTVLAFNRPLLLLGGGGYSQGDACKAFASVVCAVTDPEFAVLDMRVPEHDFYDTYGPDFSMTTKPAIHRKSENDPQQLSRVVDRAINTLEKARATRSKRDDPSLKRKA